MECCLRSEAGTAGEKESWEVCKGSGMWAGVLDSQRGLFLVFKHLQLCVFCENGECCMCACSSGLVSSLAGEEEGDLTES